MKIEVITAGQGGQGVLELANYISYFQILKGRHAAYTPSYGPETRGGKVKCYVVASDEFIDSPIVEEPDFLVVMNIPSMDFVPMLKPGGTLVVNSSLVSQAPNRNDIKVWRVPATELAAGLKQFAPSGGKDTSIAANAVMFGAYLALTGEALKTEVGAVKEVFEHFFADRKAAYIPLNVQAVQSGYSFIKEGEREGRPVPVVGRSPS
jgi:2-oxoglutarate ferredoxin oxidoreductase subunit gamma